ncbi:MAG: protein involved in cell division [Firmicutes bacterium]|nr:protein involved in cell division [Bacillota bacterium]
MSEHFSRYDRKDKSHSVYCYEGTEVLINKENIRNAEELAKYEADITMIRQYQLENENPVRGRFGTAHLRKIHQFIFQDIYPFAGKYRVEDMLKGETFFCKSEYIEENLARIFEALKTENYLKGLKVEEFSSRIAYYMSELNMIHPFREGNGRAIREFIRQLAVQDGYIIDWYRIDHDTLLSTSILSAKKELQPLTDCIYKAIVNPQCE